MDNKYYSKVIDEMKPFFEEAGITEKDGYFSNDQKAFKIEYDTEKQLYVLSAALIEENAVGEFAVIDSWLFDDTQTEKDAASVGNGFVVTLRKELGVKEVRALNSFVTLPTASKDGNINISAFTKKVLDVFPALKDEYKAHVSVYGNFLYLNFFGEHLVPRLVRLFETGTKKQIKKFYDIVLDAYEKGDRETSNSAVAVLVAAAYENQAATAAIKEMLSDNSHFLASFENMIPFFAQNKKLKDALICNQVQYTVS